MERLCVISWLGAELALAPEKKGCPQSIADKMEAWGSAHHLEWLLLKVLGQESIQLHYISTIKIARYCQVFANPSIFGSQFLPGHCVCGLYLDRSLLSLHL